MGWSRARKRGEDLELTNGRAALIACVVLLVGGGAVALIVWLESIRAWWSVPAQAWVWTFLLGLSYVQVKGSWTRDDLEAGAQRRARGRIVALMLSVPVGVALAEQALGVPLAAAPGDWPVAADRLARGGCSLLAAGSALAVFWHVVRRGASLAWATAAARGLLGLGLVWLAVWPWLPASVSLTVRIVVLAVPLGVGLIEKSARKTEGS